MSWNNIILPVILAVLGIGGTLGGAWWGANLSQKAALALHERQRQEQVEAAERERRNIRLLLWHENERNLKQLRDFWAQVEASLQPQLGYSVQAVAFENRYALASRLLSEFGHLMWNTYVARLADVLPDLAEVGGCYELHASLDTFTSLRSTLQAEFQTTDAQLLLQRFQDWKRGVQESDPTGKPITPLERDLLTFQLRTQPIWDSCYAIYTQLRPEGTNPIHMSDQSAPASTTEAQP